MSELFLAVLNMSLTASYVILVLIIVRLLLKKAPKVISYALWGLAAFRLIIPFSFESMFSLMPRNTNIVPIPHEIIYQQSPQINSGIEVIDTFASQSLPAPAVEASANSLHIYVEIGAYIWVFGIIALIAYSLVSVLLLKRQLKGAQLIEKNIFEAENLKTPFVLGLINPKIYLPVGLSKEEQNYILMHEQTHIHRKDHIIKILAFLIVSIHWFNPLVWVAFILMSIDMEMSCDERVLKKMNEDIKKPYATSLLSLAAGRHILNGSPLAFGEGNVKGRIKNVLNYKKPRFWVIFFLIIIIAAFVLVSIVIKILLDSFLKTQLGFALRATGDNPGMARALGVNTDAMKMMGLSISNGLVAFSGALAAQYQGFSDIGMGIGTIVSGLASVIIGEMLIGEKSISFATFSALLGSFIYRLSVGIALRLGFAATDLKLLTTVLVIAALGTPQIRKIIRNSSI
jgi:beta-lactamase regulating signal transducer with metallopeptidase domain